MPIDTVLRYLQCLPQNWFGQMALLLFLIQLGHQTGRIEFDIIEISEALR